VSYYFYSIDMLLQNEKRGGIYLIPLRLALSVEENQ